MRRIALALPFSLPSLLVPSSAEAQHVCEFSPERTSWRDGFLAFIME